MTRNDHEFTVLTQNAYFGANLESVLAAKTPLALIEAVAQAWARVQATSIPERAAKIAEVIAAARPDLVGLQEVVQWFHGPLEQMSLEYDFLELILAALRANGVIYTAVAVNNDLDQLAPLTADGTMIRLVDRHAVLLRIKPASSLQPFRVQTGSFSTLFPVAGLGLAGVPRSWIAADVHLDGRVFRFIESHIESYDAGVQLAQARELIAGPGNVGCPAIMAGDFNSNGNQDPAVLDCTPTYPTLVGAGFEDVWPAVNPGDPGNTGVQAADLRNPESILDRRIDLILARGGVTPLSAELVGVSPAARTASGLWPSDHAGVLATLSIR